MQHKSLRELKKIQAPFSSAVLGYATGYARSPENLEAIPLYANINELFGWGSTQTQSAFLLAILTSGGLAMFGALTYAMKRRAWAGVLGGCLFGGALFVQLFFDGSQAAIGGMCMMLPLAVVTVETIRKRRVADHVLLALLGAGLAAVYPLFVPGVALAGISVLLVLAVRTARNRTRPQVRALLAGGASVAAIGASHPGDELRRVHS